MPAITGLKGLSLPTGLNTLIAAYGNDFVNVTNGVGYQQNLDINATKVEMDVFLQNLFFQNYSNTPKNFDGTKWSQSLTPRVPLSKFIKRWNGRIFYAYLNIGGTVFPSRTAFSDPPTAANLTWGIEWGSNLVTNAGNNRVDSVNSGFRTYNIKRGDPFVILTGPNTGQYIVASVPGDTTIILATPITGKSPIQFSSTGDSYIVGGNFFESDKDDGDVITGLGENNFYFFPQLLTFKQDSLFRYDGTKNLNLKVYGAYGTTSNRSIVNIHELTIYFYGVGQSLSTGFYAYDGRESVKISGGIDPYILGINPGNYSTIIGWKENELARFYVGNILNNDYKINITNAVCTYDYNTKTWSVDPIADVITASSEFRQGGTKQTYLGTANSQIMLTPSGNDFNGTPIGWNFQTSIIYPAGTSVVCKITRIQVFHENAGGMKVKRKYHLNPFTTQNDYVGLGMLDSERTEFPIPENDSQTAGLQLEFIGTELHKANALIKKIVVFYRPTTTVIQ